MAEPLIAVALLADVVALESSQNGFVALGFPQLPGVMVPADAVIGGLDQLSNKQQVGTHKLTAKDPAGIKNSTGWATGLGAVRQNDLVAHISYTTLCFSRPTTVANASIAGNLDPAGELLTASRNITLLASPGIRSVM
eukprot:gene1936-2266_t